MAKKEAVTSNKPTRRQVALSRKEQEQQKLIYMALGLIGGLILIVLAIGLVQTYIIEPGSPVAVVNGEEISTRDYQTENLIERFVLEDQYQQIVSELSALPPADENDQFSTMIRSQYEQFATQILQQRSFVDRQALDNMILDKLIAAEAEKRGLSISENEVTETINRQLAGRQGGLTAAAVVETSTAGADASATAAMWTPTPTFTPSPTLTSTEALSPSVAAPVNTPVPPPTATPNIIDEIRLATEYSNWISTITNQTGLNEAQYRDYMKNRVLREKLAEALGQEVPTTAEHANARHILIETEEEANEIISRLEAGETFADLAAELSTDPGSGENGGELGFVPKGTFVEPVEEAIFSLPIGQVSEPVESQFGWHIIEVMEREEQELSPVSYAQRQRSAYSDWAATARQEAVIEDMWTVDKAPEDIFLEQFQ